MTFFAFEDFKMDMVSVEANKVNNVLIGVNMLTIV